MHLRGLGLGLLFVVGCSPFVPPPVFPAPVVPALPADEPPDALPPDPCPGGEGVPGDYLDPCAPMFMLTPWIAEGLAPRLFPALCIPDPERLACPRVARRRP